MWFLFLCCLFPEVARKQPFTTTTAAFDEGAKKIVHGHLKTLCNELSKKLLTGHIDHVIISDSYCRRKV